MAKASGVRVIWSIKMKRKQLTLWGPLLTLRAGEIDYGHWWFELGDRRDPASESYGWWPGRTLRLGWRSLTDVLFGLPGELNGRTLYPAGRADRDPHHDDEDDTLDEAFYVAVAADDPRTDREIEDCLRQFALNYQGKWQWFFGWGKNCHTFQRAAMKHCRVKRGPSTKVDAGEPRHLA